MTDGRHGYTAPDTPLLYSCANTRFVITHKTFRFIKRAFIPKRIGEFGHRLAQHIVPTSALKAAMHCLVVRVALR
jgi:endonuclease III-like uncharacterized protein